jgi:hypothetical protein
MAHTADLLSPLARELIAQCQREIAAAWEQVAAGRRILEQSAWLLTRWGEQPSLVPSIAPHRAMGGRYEILDDAPRRPLTIAQAAAQVLGRARRQSVDAVV